MLRCMHSESSAWKSVEIASISKAVVGLLSNHICLHVKSCAGLARTTLAENKPLLKFGAVRQFSYSRSDIRYANASIIGIIYYSTA